MPVNTHETFAEKYLKDERSIILTGIVIISGVAWLHMAGWSWNAGSPSGTPHGTLVHWNWTSLFSHLIMWVVMMVAMMLPSATPMVLTFATLSKKKRETHQAYAGVSIFISAYLIVIGIYSLAMTLIQGWLHNHALVTPTGMSNSHIFTGLLLLAAGIFQWSRLKQACLWLCRNPFSYFLKNWRDGVSGAMIMGIKHGIYCTGCCGILMALMFVGGVMNLVWMIVITLVVSIEKIAPKGDVFAKAIGLLMIGGGFYFLLAPASGV